MAGGGSSIPVRGSLGSAGKGWGSVQGLTYNQLRRLDDSEGIRRGGSAAPGCSGRCEHTSGEAAARSGQYAALEALGDHSEATVGVGCDGDGRKRRLYGGGRTGSDGGGSAPRLCMVRAGNTFPYLSRRHGRTETSQRRELPTLIPSVRRQSLGMRARRENAMDQWTKACARMVSAGATRCRSLGSPPRRGARRTDRRSRARPGAHVQRCTARGGAHAPALERGPLISSRSTLL
jgi:hypothetical protein